MVTSAQSDTSAIMRAKLDDALAELAASFEGVLGLGARNLETNEEFFWNEELVFPQGSTIKLLILIELFRQVEAAIVALDASYTVRDADKVGGAGILKEVGDGTVTLTVHDLAVLMIVLSDNTASNLLIDLVGINQINHTMETLGFTQTRLTRRFQDYHALHDGLDNTSTATEMIDLLTRLYRGELLQEETTADVLDLMQRPKTSELRELLPDDLVIAHKPGGLNGGRSDAGIVYVPGSPYAIALMTNFAYDTEESRQIIARASWLIWRYFDMRSTYTGYGARPRVSYEAAMAEGPLRESNIRRRLHE